MNQMLAPAPIVEAEPAVTEAFKIDAFRGRADSSVSSQWFRRPDDQKFLSLDALYQSVVGRKEHSHELITRPNEIMAFGSEQDTDTMTLKIKGQTGQFAPTHLSFGQLCQLGKMGRATGP